MRCQFYDMRAGRAYANGKTFHVDTLFHSSFPEEDDDGMVKIVSEKGLLPLELCERALEVWNRMMFGG